MFSKVASSICFGKIRLSRLLGTISAVAISNIIIYYFLIKSSSDNTISHDHFHSTADQLPFKSNNIYNGNNSFQIRRRVPSSNHEETERMENIANTRMYVKSATFDPRNKKKLLIKIWAISDKKYDTYCHLKYDGIVKHLTVKAYVDLYGQYVTPFCAYQPGVIECPIKKQPAPTYVSISHVNTNITNSWIKVRFPKYKPPSKRRFGICVKTLVEKSDEDVYAIVEWLELQRILGVHQVIMYDVKNVSSKVSSMLQKYVKLGFLLLKPWSLPVRTASKNIYCHKNGTFDSKEVEATKKASSKVECIRITGQFIQYMDCLYRHGDDFTYLAFIDIDEFIVPTSVYTWQEMFAKIESQRGAKRSASYVFDEATFHLTKWSSNAYITTSYADKKIHLTTKENTRLVNLRRVDKGGGSHHKSIVKPHLVVRTNVHDWSAVKNSKRNTKYISHEIGRLNHYKKPCYTDTPEQRYEEIPKVKDYVMTKYQKELKRNMELVFQKGPNATVR